METNKKQTENTTEDKAKTANPLDGFDFSKLMQNDGLMELLKHLLSGGGAMAANYFLWIKPLQEKNEALATKIALQEKRINDLEDEQDRMLEELKEKREGYDNSKVRRSDYFDLKKSSGNSGNFQRKNVRI